MYCTFYFSSAIVITRVSLLYTFDRDIVHPIISFANSPSRRGNDRFVLLCLVLFVEILVDPCYSFDNCVLFIHGISIYIYISSFSSPSFERFARPEARGSIKDYRVGNETGLESVKWR